MTVPRGERPDLPEYMTWDELERLPEELAEWIELRDRRVVWIGGEPPEHQMFTCRIWNALERCSRAAETRNSHPSMRVVGLTALFFGYSGKSDFAIPDFMIHRELASPFQDARAADALLVGEVLSPWSDRADLEAKKTRYASARIPWYWEVALAREKRAIETIRAYALETGHGQVPGGVCPLRPANYLVAGEWTPADTSGIEIDFPFPINIPWSELEY
ncbi:Uma2 family endonuclease [Nocardia sp. NPDC059180]|uniref:Uma2 family endonuclease n=1 Tax=Nocardia sp. NPDC059180 TaxID=3346761 RepID=UPI0036BBF00A